MWRTQATIGRAKASGLCPVCGAPSQPWKDGTPKLTCGSRECQTNWVRYGGPAPKGKKRPAQGWGGRSMAGVVVDDPVVRALDGTAERVQAGEATLFDLEAEEEETT